ncbi:MAG: M23 family metallopeptidase, partial [Armatimonadota bacterium]
MPISGFVLALALGSTIHLPPAPHLESPTIEPDNICMEPITVPLVFPVAGKCDWEDSFLAARTGHRHHGQDLMAAKMTPLVACFDGTIKLGRPKTPGGHIWVTVKGDNGWTAQYYHVNNDTPGTNDGTGLDEYAFAPGIKDGDHVEAGQFIAYVGDSGNAEGGPSHCHFELWETGS